MAENEKWKDIPGYYGLYQASTEGKVRSITREIVRCDGIAQIHTGKILSPCVNASGYLVVSLRKDGGAKSYLVSRLVAATFISNPENLPEVNHKNEIKTDNHIANLEWVGRKENCNYGTRNYRHSLFMKEVRGERHSHPSPVLCTTTGKRFSCIREAAEYYEQKSASGISACCRGLVKYAGRLPDGRELKWEYANTR